MRLPLIMLFALAACSQPLGSSGSEVERGAERFLRLPETMAEIVVLPLPEDDKKRLLLGAFDRACTEPMLTSLVDWTKTTSLDSGDYPEVIRSIRSAVIDGPIAGPELSREFATATYAIETTEIFSLASNLASVDDLFDRYPITNMTRGDAFNLIDAAHLPELVELQLTSRMIVGIELLRVDHTWKVSRVSIEPKSAVLVIREAE